MKKLGFIVLLLVFACKSVIIEEPQQEIEIPKGKEGFQSITSWEWYVEYKDGSRIGGNVSADTTSTKSAMDYAFEISEPHARDTVRVKYYVVKPILIKN